jgi:hypothetical protein
VPRRAVLERRVCSDFTTDKSIKKPKVGGAGGFYCQCQAGWEGTVCGGEVDECASAPCLNGGVCEDGVNGYTCDCVDFWMGENCALGIPPELTVAGVSVEQYRAGLAAGVDRGASAAAFLFREYLLGVPVNLGRRMYGIPVPTTCAREYHGLPIVHCVEEVCAAAGLSLLTSDDAVADPTKLATRETLVSGWSNGCSTNMLAAISAEICGTGCNSQLWSSSGAGTKCANLCTWPGESWGGGSGVVSCNCNPPCPSTPVKAVCVER